tara:strand:+ start:891 stop:1178 length:288 start_codon:yes stop_codon:yes gene_type:complete
MPRTNASKTVIETHHKIINSFTVKDYEDCETIEEKIKCCETYLKCINKCLEEARLIGHSSCLIGAIKNEISNPIYNKKFYETRLRILRKQLKRKN